MPEVKDVHVDRILSNVSVKYRNEDLIWMRVLPVVPVSFRSDKYYEYAKEDVFKVPDDMVSPKAEPNQIDWKVTSKNYSVVDAALADYVPVEEVENADAPLQPLTDTTEFLTMLLQNAAENRAAAKVFAAANYPTGNKVQLSGTDQWSDSANSDPIDDILVAMDAAFMRPNTLVLGNDVWVKLRAHPKILDAVKASTRFQASSGGLATVSEIASLFDVPNVLIGRARKVTSKEGQTATYGRIWGKHAALLWVPPGRLTTKSIAWAMTFVEQNFLTWRGFDGKRGVKGAHYLKVGWNYDHRIIASDVGYFIEDAVA